LSAFVGESNSPERHAWVGGETHFRGGPRFLLCFGVLLEKVFRDRREPAALERGSTMARHDWSRADAIIQRRFGTLNIRARLIHGEAGKPPRRPALVR
jgi:hypothetical protein